MVLDIRGWREETAPTAETSLDQLLQGEQLNADDLEQLLTIAEDSDDSRRLAAIDILSHHRSWLASLGMLRRIVRLAHKEHDRGPAAALVQALRQCDEVAQFLTSKRACGRPRGRARRTDQPPDPRTDRRGPSRGPPSRHRGRTPRQNSPHPSLYGALCS